MILSLCQYFLTMCVINLSMCCFWIFSFFLRRVIILLPWVLSLLMSGLSQLTWRCVYTYWRPFGDLSSIYYFFSHKSHMTVHFFLHFTTSVPFSINSFVTFIDTWYSYSLPFYKLFIWSIGHMSVFSCILFPTILLPKD